ncbi:MAG: MlaD family protein [Desulfobacterota bacterium]|jgi:paraquat-inducible protein B|nr:MlaD family protein [Thermodesulfobacteriota bacterium]
MSKPVNKTMIGLFVVGSLALIVVAIGVLGSGKLFKERTPYVMVFEGSVKGLNIGSPVVFRGVKIGAVSSIHMHFNYSTKALTILVYADFEPTKIEITNMDDAAAKLGALKDRYSNMRELIGRGLRAQLEMQSIVTGQLQIALDFFPDKPAIYTGIDKTIQEIPTIPTPLQELTKKLESLPVEDILNNINSAADGIAKLANSRELKESIANLNIALKDIQTLVRNVNDQVKPLSAGLTDTIRDAQKLVRNADSQVASLGTNLNEAIGDGRKLIRNADGTVESIKVKIDGTLTEATSALAEARKLIQELESSAREDSTLMYRLNETLREVEKAARSLSTLTDYLERHPEALLGGKGEGGGK